MGASRARRKTLTKRVLPPPPPQRITARKRATSPVYIDVHVGRRIRERRAWCGLSQTALAEACNITFQQLQKYETGKNRVSASRLWQLAAAMDAPVAFFFEGVEQGEAYEPLLDTHRSTLELVRAIDACPPTIRKRLHELAKASAVQHADAAVAAAE